MRALLDSPHELLDHWQRNVSLKQGDANLTSRGVDVGLGEPSLAAKVLEGVGKAV